MVKRILLVALAAGLIAVVAFGTYTQLYLPSRTPILNGAPLVAPNKLEKLSAEPLGGRPPAEREQLSAALHDAVATIKPDHRIDAEEMYVRRTGYDWVALRKMASDYLGRFGFFLAADDQADVNGATVDYLVWRPEWLHSVFDDRIVVAVALRTLHRPGTNMMVFGYFVLRPR